MISADERDHPSLYPLSLRERVGVRGRGSPESLEVESPLNLTFSGREKGQGAYDPCVVARCAAPGRRFQM